jgi:hypothetical protein
VVVSVVHVTISDKPVGAVHPNTRALAGETDAETDLKVLLIQMYQEWQRAETEKPLVTLA